ncbi:hypothetical protein F5141DRAFT_1067673 [Pisolithus sp. B1]|nr:hypothetical protein F5141DRAFT_1067673 [Pisolithus sp. B1]
MGANGGSRRVIGKWRESISMRDIHVNVFIVVLPASSTGNLNILHSPINDIFKDHIVSSKKTHLSSHRCITGADLLSSNNKSQHPLSSAKIGRNSELSDTEVSKPYMEAYLLLEVVRSNHQISLKWKDLAYEIVHHNTVALQLNCIVLEQAKRDLCMVDECIGHVHLIIRQSGHSAASVYAMQESWPCSSEDAPPVSSTGFDVCLD